MFVLCLHEIAIYATSHHGSLIFFDFCLRNYKLAVSYQEIMWKNRGAVHVKKSFLDMLKRQMWRKN